MWERVLRESGADGDIERESLSREALFQDNNIFNKLRKFSKSKMNIVVMGHYCESK